MSAIRTLAIHVVYVFALFGAALVPASAADLNTTEYSQRALAGFALRDDLTRRASLYLLRSAFDVIDPAQIPLLLAKDATAARTTGRSDDEVQLLDEALIAEGSYYIVSLSYLIAVEGAAWPNDKPASTYSRDAAVLLADLQRKWLHQVQTHGDLVPILRAVDKINGWTEGYTTLPSRLEHFSQVDDLVAAAVEDNAVNAQP